MGIRVPRTCKEALDIDRANGNTLWKDAIDKEMAKIIPALKILEEGSKPPVGYQKITCHMIFDLKMDFS